MSKLRSGYGKAGFTLRSACLKLPAGLNWSLQASSSADMPVPEIDFIRALKSVRPSSRLLHLPRGRDVEHIRVIWYVSVVVSHEGAYGPLIDVVHELGHSVEPRVRLLIDTGKIGVGVRPRGREGAGREEWQRGLLIHPRRIACAGVARARHTDGLTARDHDDARRRVLAWVSRQRGQGPGGRCQGSCGSCADDQTARHVHAMRLGHQVDDHRCNQHQHGGLHAADTRL
eukprot:scaffold2058_cov115-Isochrysis_galbana.AAC.13